MNIEFLRKTGMAEGEIKVYGALLEIGISTLNSIQEKTGIDRRNIYDILNKLIEKGLVSYTIEQGKKTFQITHPKKIISFLEEKKKGLDEVEQEIKPSLPKLIEKFNQKKIDVRAETFRGNESIKALFDEILEYKESFWLGGNSFEEYKAVPENLQIWFQHWMKKRVKQKHVMNDIVDYGTFLKGLEPNKKKVHKKNFYRYKQLPEGMNSPMVIIIFGNKVAQVLWGEQSFAFVLESEKIKESFKKYFDHFWKQANAEVFEGIKGFKTFYEWTLKEMGKGDCIDIMGVPREANEKFQAYLLDWNNRRIKLGIKMRILYNHDSKEFGKEREKMKLTEVRYMKQELETPAWIDIFKEYVVTINVHGEPICFLIKNKESADSYRKYFEVMWKQAKK
jgi:HTH-type transcriptional regulator, sugar sensing transcriptional regulator